eukprot:591212-Hanusia_phi.AAC.1
MVRSSGDKTGQDRTGQDTTRHDKTRQDKTRQETGRNHKTNIYENTRTDHERRNCKLPAGCLVENV